MIRYENECCGCMVPAYPCMGESCHKRNAPHFYCDKCKSEVEELYYGSDSGKELCADCALEELDKVKVV